MRRILVAILLIVPSPLFHLAHDVGSSLATLF